MLRPFQSEDLWRFVPQPAQSLDDDARARILHEAVPRGPCWTFEHGGQVLGVGGFAHTHPGWATAWTILADGKGPAMVALTRAVARRVREHNAARIDMHVDPAQPDSARWAAMLGFRLEAWLARAQPNGRDMAIWLYEGGRRG
tara:strand:+ start:713 stop:1141 length:429 start_codon:yes stop_codon:yes gene_type:complete